MTGPQSPQSPDCFNVISRPPVARCPNIYTFLNSEFGHRATGGRPITYKFNNSSNSSKFPDFCIAGWNRKGKKRRDILCTTPMAGRPMSKYMIPPHDPFPYKWMRFLCCTLSKPLMKVRIGSKAKATLPI